MFDRLRTRLRELAFLNPGITINLTDERGEEWPGYLGPLTAWLERRRARLFFVRWLTNSQESRALGLFALPHIVSSETMQHLATANTIAVPQMLSCLAGTALYREQNILVDLVKRAAALVIDRDLIACANRYGRPILGAHLERYLIDAMRRLVVSHAAWAPNHERSRVWYGRDGLFIVWPNAVTEIRKLLEEDELPGIPKAPDTILEILLGAGVFESGERGGDVLGLEGGAALAERGLLLGALELGELPRVEVAERDAQGVVQLRSVEAAGEGAGEMLTGGRGVAEHEVAAAERVLDEGGAAARHDQAGRDLVHAGADHGALGGGVG